jgi:hypothetical protein
VGAAVADCFAGFFGGAPFTVMNTDPCGDGLVGAGEQYDPRAMSAGCAGGELCTSQCECRPFSPTCGNGVIDGGEEV